MDIMSAPRYALYFLPEKDSALDRLGRAWIDSLPADLTAEARVYGFHATLKAPFRLADDQSEAALRAACAAFAATQAPLTEVPPALALLHDFYALPPGAPSTALQTLAAECVRRFDAFRAPLSQAEMAKRLRTPLTPRQRQLLDLWGYPYVLDEYRFHLTLTRRLAPAELPAVERVLLPLTAEAVAEPLAVRSLCLMHQPPGGSFSLLARYPLEDACAS
jgi:hypothetical protein